jgi:hypothetical protein
MSLPKTPRAKGVYIHVKYSTYHLLSPSFNRQCVQSFFLSSSSLEALERGLQEASQEFLGRLITTTLEAIDIKLMDPAR